VQVASRDGALRDVSIQAVAAGNQLVISLEDMTERIEAGRLLRERQEQLARVGRVSTLGQLAASLAHELEQPLGAILNNAETASLLLSGDAPDRDELRAIVDDILADNRRAGAVLDRIRGMVRQDPFELQAVPVDALLHDVVQLLRPVAAKRKIALELSCELGTPAVEGDPVLLQQALLNLVLNSFEAIGTRTDGRIELRAGEAASGIVEIAIGDNGGGVRLADLPLLFEPFHTTKSDGLGMGLPLVQSIIEQHGGKLRLANQPGRGLAVYVQLPVHRS
jgi:C4-dicarboxylate-specific signal transduction histidine kinase